MKHIREIRVSDIIKYFFGSLLALIVIWVAYAVLAITNILPIKLIYILPVFIILTCFFTKYFLIGIVLIYKAYAPLEVRGQCRFEPTCSTYMIMALKKYGLFIGVFKGIRRLLRCKPPNGGKDYP